MQTFQCPDTPGNFSRHIILIVLFWYYLNSFSFSTNTIEAE